METAISAAANTVCPIAAIDHRSTGILYDRANLIVMGGPNDEAAFRLQRPLVRHIHISDCVLPENCNADGAAECDPHAFRQRVPGEGKGRWRASLRRPVESDYDSYLTAEYVGG